PTVGIVGAGIGGLTLAIRLVELGFRPRVFETRNRESIAREGAFLTLAPNGMNGLRTVGCYQSVKDVGVATTGIKIRSGRGKRLALVDQTDHEAAFGAPSITLGRGVLAE